jgi:hypothetical protein
MIAHTGLKGGMILLKQPITSKMRHVFKLGRNVFFIAVFKPHPQSLSYREGGRSSAIN